VTLRPLDRLAGFREVQVHRAVGHNPSATWLTHATAVAAATADTFEVPRRRGTTPRGRSWAP
jgi:hypothetical protein